MAFEAEPGTAAALCFLYYNKSYKRNYYERIKYNYGHNNSYSKKKYSYGNGAKRKRHHARGAFFRAYYGGILMCHGACICIARRERTRRV